MHEIAIPTANESEKDLLVEELKVNRTLDTIWALEVIAFTLLVVVFNSLLNQMRPTKRRTRSILESVPFEFSKTNYIRFSKIALILIFYKLFIMLIQLFLSNSIQTKKVLTDSSMIITDLKQIPGSKYRFCYFADSDIYRVVKNFPKDHIFRVLFEKHACELKLSFTEPIDFTHKAVLIDPVVARTVGISHMGVMPNILSHFFHVSNDPPQMICPE